MIEELARSPSPCCITYLATFCHAMIVYQYFHSLSVSCLVYSLVAQEMCGVTELASSGSPTRLLVVWPEGFDFGQL